MLIKDKKYSYNDVMVVPAKVSSIEHRAECDVFHKDGYLPIFTAPMSTVVNCLNYELFEQNHIHAIMPRNIEYDIRLEYALNNRWAAFSLKEFENFLNFLFMRKILHIVLTYALLINGLNSYAQLSNFSMEVVNENGAEIIKIINEKWEHTCLDGTPDLRFKNNTKKLADSF